MEYKGSRKYVVVCCVVFLKFGDIGGGVGFWLGFGWLRILFLFWCWLRNFVGFFWDFLVVRNMFGNLEVLFFLL